MTDLAIEFREQLGVFHLKGTGPLHGLLPPVLAGQEAVPIIFAERAEGLALPVSALDEIFPPRELGFHEGECLDRCIQNCPSSAA